jgi:predicted transcriptional regulator YdeE
MNPKVVEEPEFTVIGIEARTSNAREMSGTGVIANQWARFRKDNLLAQIPDKADAAILAVYSDYASDENEEYSFLIGARVSSAEQVPAGMVARQVPAGRYAIFTSERGPVEKVVMTTWQKIWAAPGIKRAYKVDFELYDERARDPKNAQVDISIGIKEASTNGPA